MRMCKKAGAAGNRAAPKKTPGPEEKNNIEYYEARSSITGPCGHKHKTKALAEKCARSFAARYRRKNPLNVHTYWHVDSVDSNQVRKRVSEDL
jgi:hypothetical protein